MHRISVHFTHVKMERDVFVEEVPHALMLMDVILMTSDCVVSDDQCLHKSNIALLI